MSIPADHPHQRGLIGRGVYFVGGPLLGLPLLLVALFLGLTGPPSWSPTALGAIAGYVGLWLAFLKHPSVRSAWDLTTPVLLIVGLLAIGPYLMQAQLIFRNPPFSILQTAIAALFLGPIAVATHYLCSMALLMWRRRGVHIGA
jgi:hypothetical protein